MKAGQIPLGALLAREDWRAQTHLKTKLNDEDRRAWVTGFEGLRQRWLADGGPMRAWIRAHRALIDQTIRKERSLS